MKQSSLLAAAVASALLFAGCNNQTSTTGTTSSAAKAPSAPVKPENTAATVNGQAISKESVALMTQEIEQRRGPHGVPEDKIIDELVSRELLKQEAQQQNLTSEPAYAARLENMMRIGLSQIAAENYIKKATVTDEEAKKEYEQKIGAMKQPEYKARHILVETEAEAKDVIAKLGKGGKFDDLAKKLSKDPGTKKNGGDLGWFNPAQMVPPFSAAVAALKNGETTAAPVQTQFGWHVIQREESREQTPPPFDQVKEQIKNMLQTQKLQQHIAELKTAAKIDRPAPPEKKPEAPVAEEGKDKTAPAEQTAVKPEEKANQDGSLEAGKPVPEKKPEAEATPDAPAPAPAPAPK